MKTLKKILWYLLGIIILLGVVAVIFMAVSPKKMQLEVSTEMNAPAALIYNVVNDLKSWPDWGTWYQEDTSMISSYSENSVGLGAKAEWQSDVSGNGSQEIIASVAGDSIKTALIFDGFDGVSYSTWKFKEENGKTSVSWDMDGAESPFYMRPFNLIFKGSVASNYKNGLASLKKMVETRAKEKIYDGYKIKTETRPEKHYIFNRQEVPFSQISAFYQQNLASLFGKIQKAKVEMEGMPAGLVFKWDESRGVADMGAAIPTKNAINMQGVSSITLEERSALVVDYYGDFSKTEKAHLAIDKYMKDYGLLYDSPIIEEYLSDPAEEPNPDKWLTRIIYYIAE